MNKLESNEGPKKMTKKSEHVMQGDAKRIGSLVRRRLTDQRTDTKDVSVQKSEIFSYIFLCCESEAQASPNIKREAIY